MSDCGIAAIAGAAQLSGLGRLLKGARGGNCPGIST